MLHKRTQHLFLYVAIVLYFKEKEKNLELLGSEPLSERATQENH